MQLWVVTFYKDTLSIQSLKPIAKIVLKLFAFTMFPYIMYSEETTKGHNSKGKEGIPKVRPLRTSGPLL